MRGIKGLLGATVRTSKPRSLQEAYDVAIKERDIYMEENWSKQTQTSRSNNFNYTRKDYRKYDGPRDERINRRPEFDRNLRFRDQLANHARPRDYDRPFNKMKAFMPRVEDRKQYDRNNHQLNHIQTTYNQELHNIEDGNFQLKASADKQGI